MAFLENLEKNALIGFCQIISDVLYKGICLEIIHYVLNQIVISVCPLSELSLVKPLKYAAASDWNLLQK